MRRAPLRVRERSIFNASFSLLACGAVILSGAFIGCEGQREGNRDGAKENLFLQAGEQEQGWPTLRGANLDGHSNEINLADKWSPGGPPVLWRRSLGQGYSSFVANRDRVLTQYQTLAGQYLLCLDSVSGSTLWSYRYDDAFESTGMYPGPRSTPTISDRHIYFTTPDARVSCLNWDGRLVWSVDLKSRYGSRGTGFGYSCSPIIAGQSVVLPLGGRDAAMVALDKASGEVRWASGNDSASYVPALPATIDGESQVMGFMQHALVGYDLADGAELWRVDLSRGYDEHAAWPIVEGNLAWIAAPFQNGCQLYRIQPRQNPPVELLYESQAMSNDVVSSVLSNGYVYGFDLAEAQSKMRRPSRGAFRCVDFSTGAIAWSNGTAKERRTEDFGESLRSQAIGHSSVIVADGKLILLSDIGDLILAKANSDSYRELDRARLLPGKTNWSTPALHRGHLFIRNHEEAICVYLGAPDLDLESMRRPFWQQSLRLEDASGIKPEFALALPTGRFLLHSFAASAVAFAIATLVVSLATSFRKYDSHSFRCRLAIVSFLLCITAGPVLTHASDRFVFTWPGCLFIAFVVAVYQMALRRGSPTPSAVAGRLVAANFLLSCLGYFLLCQRLGLVPHWCFLCGFVVALPSTLLARHLAKKETWKCRAIEFTSLILAGVAYWIGAAAMMWWAYRIQW